MSAVEHCLVTGQKIGSYEVIRQLGEGAMGEVYEVVDRKLDRHAALKVVPPWLAHDKRVVARFRREVMATCQVRHPGVVHIFDYGVLPEQSLPYFIMEYLEGETLHTRIWRAGRSASGRLGLSCLNILRQIALALDAVHRHGLVHRDLKPGNVMLVLDPTAAGGEQAKILDFGIVKILQGAEELSAEDSGDGTTVQGAILGTPRYMAPEQWRCGAHIDGKTDVYALGVMAFLGLSGRMPFIASDGPALGMMHCFVRPPSLASVAPDIPPELVALVAQMLKKNPAKRPTMLEVAETLGRFTPMGPTASAMTMPESISSSSEVFLSAEYESTLSLSGHEVPEVKPEVSGLELTQPLLPVTQRITQLMQPVPGAKEDTPSELVLTPLSTPTLGAEANRETSETMLVGSNDNFKIERGGSAWLGMGAALALIVCATYFMFGLHPKPAVQRMLTLQSAAPAAATALSPRPASAPLMQLPTLASVRPRANEPEPAPAPLLSALPAAKKTQLRQLPTASCIRYSDWSDEQEHELMRVFVRSRIRLYPKERLVLVHQMDMPHLRRAPKSMPHRMRASLLAELRRSRDVFAASSPAYVPGQAGRIEVRCPLR